MKSVRVIDSHTGGEPTRVVVEGAPDLGDGSMAERLERFHAEHDDFQSAVVNEPRGSEVMVGALLVSPVNPACVAGAIFFNNVGYLGMCGHGSMGVVATLAHLGRIGAGAQCIETPVGAITAELNDNGSVTIENVASFRLARRLSVNVDGHGPMCGDVAWGGNWFFLSEDNSEELVLGNIARLTDLCWRVRRALAGAGIRGADGHEIDHIELTGPAQRSDARCRNFVLCPGGAYDRSPCGTGTSAKLACLAADGKLGEGEIWRQESIVGSVFDGRYRMEGGQVRPSITGRAYVNAEANLLFDSRDPFRMGIRG